MRPATRVATAILSGVVLTVLAAGAMAFALSPDPQKLGIFGALFFGIIVLMLFWPMTLAAFTIFGWLSWEVIVRRWPEKRQS